MPDLDPDHITVLTFDCYGTLIDWEAGVIEALEPLLARNGVTLSDDDVIRLFQDLEEPLCEPPFKPYREVLADVMDGFGQHFGFPVGAVERGRLAASVPSWRPFADTVEALRASAVATGSPSSRTSTMTCLPPRHASSRFRSTRSSPPSRPGATSPTSPSSRRLFGASGPRRDR